MHYIKQIQLWTWGSKAYTITRYCETLYHSQSKTSSIVGLFVGAQENTQKKQPTAQFIMMNKKLAVQFIMMDKHLAVQFIMMNKKLAVQFIMMNKKLAAQFIMMDKNLAAQFYSR